MFYIIKHISICKDQATYGMESCKADWDEQALLSAQSHLKYSAYSYKGLVDMLVYDGFSEEQAVYGADNCEVNWNEQAVLSAQTHLKYSSYSHDSLVDMLIYDGFTTEQAKYGARESGL